MSLFIGKFLNRFSSNLLKFQVSFRSQKGFLSYISTNPEPSKTFIFRQLFDYQSYTYTYLLGCALTKEAIIIDPVLDQVKRDIQLAEELGLNLKLGLNTHVHADHVTGTGQLKKILGESFRSVLSENSGGEADVKIKEGDVIEFGIQHLDVLSTPGHTNGCLSYVLHDHSLVMTGDALLIRGCGRTDFQQGSSSTLYESVHNKILSLPDHYKLYPGHDYRGFTHSTVYEEKNCNPRLTLSKENFIQFMKDLNLAYPKLIDVAVPANMKCGELSKEAVEGEELILPK